MSDDIRKRTEGIRERAKDCYELISHAYDDIPWPIEQMERLEKESEGLLQKTDEERAVRLARNAALEEAAQVAEGTFVEVGPWKDAACWIAQCIRAIKSKPKEDA